MVRAQKRLIILFMDFIAYSPYHIKIIVKNSFRSSKHNNQFPLNATPFHPLGQFLIVRSQPSTTSKHLYNIVVHILRSIVGRAIINDHYLFFLIELVTNTCYIIAAKILSGKVSCIWNRFNERPQNPRCLDKYSSEYGQSLLRHRLAPRPLPVGTHSCQRPFQSVEYNDPGSLSMFVFD